MNVGYNILHITQGKNTHMKRLLCIVSAMNTGGAETFLMKIYRALDREKYQMDFCVNSGENFYEKEILEMGGRIYKIPSKSQNMIQWHRELKQIVHAHGYQYVIRVCEHSLAVLDLLVAREGGAKHLIMRSSNAGSGSSMSTFVHKCFRFLPKTVPTVKLAPSTEAAEYTFGKGCVQRGEAVLLHNAIDTNIYRFDEIGRERIRKELNLESKFVVGHVGRFNQQKNHEFLIDVFHEVWKSNPEARLVLVGKGELEEAIHKKVHTLGLDDYVIFTGVRKDIPQLMSAFDVFAFPSLYEGMPNTVIEAQATGLPCVVSDTITQQAKVTDLVSFYALAEAPTVWADTCAHQKAGNRLKYNEDLKAAGYDINDVVPQFVKWIFETNTKDEL